MQLINTPSRYGAVSQAIHWATVLLVIILLATGNFGDIEADEPGNALYDWHSSLGVLVLWLVLARLLWLFVTPAPRLSPQGARSARWFARAVHVTFYGLLLALPLTGWWIATAEGAPVSFFGLAPLPPWGSAAREEFYEELHEVLANALLTLAILHTLAALKHHFIDKDDVLIRMLPRSKRADGTRTPG